MEDPVVDEIRRQREEHAARFNFDLEAIVADLERSAAGRNWPQASFHPRRIATRVQTAEEAAVLAE